ncbi:hypothetical protein JB92DRAFT_2729273 [Gautieria morchelliformis]|nr:hypothetical protein JB92DRAFT_2729273 [Gautieria morchelliformis]
MNSGILPRAAVSPTVVSPIRLRHLRKIIVFCWHLTDSFFHSGKSCPPTAWYWHNEKSCCVPNHPLPANPPPPQCKNGYDWNKATQCCERGSPTPTYSPSKPSQTPKGSYPPPNYGNGGNPAKNEPPKYSPPKKSGSGYKKRSAAALCPQALHACPVGLISNDYECLDTTAELRSCGGCASIGKGEDCNAIEGAWNVGCEAGSCAVYTCKLGYQVASDGKSCIKY